MTDQPNTENEDDIVNLSLRMAIGLIVVIATLFVLYPREGAIPESGFLSGPLWLVYSPDSDDNTLGIAISAMCVLFALAPCVRPTFTNIILAVFSVFAWIATGVWIASSAAS